MCYLSAFGDPRRVSVDWVAKYYITNREKTEPEFNEAKYSDASEKFIRMEKEIGITRIKSQEFPTPMELYAALVKRSCERDNPFEMFKTRDQF